MQQPPPPQSAVTAASEGKMEVTAFDHYNIPSGVCFENRPCEKVNILFQELSTFVDKHTHIT